MAVSQRYLLHMLQKSVSKLAVNWMKLRFLKIYMYVFMAVTSLICSAHAFSICTSRAPYVHFIEVPRLLPPALASLAEELGSGMGAT